MGACGSSESVNKTKAKNDQVSKSKKSDSNINNKYENQQQPYTVKQDNSKYVCNLKERR